GNCDNNGACQAIFADFSRLRRSVSPTQRRHGCAGRDWPRAPGRPFGHETFALLEQVSAAISLLNLAADCVGETQLCDNFGKMAALSRPIAEAAAEAVCRHAGAHLLQEAQHGDLANLENPLLVAW